MYDLTDDQIKEITSLLRDGEPLPALYRSLLFPGGVGSPPMAAHQKPVHELATAGASQQVLQLAKFADVNVPRQMIDLLR